MGHIGPIKKPRLTNLWLVTNITNTSINQPKKAYRKNNNIYNAICLIKTSSHIIAQSKKKGKKPFKGN